MPGVGEVDAPAGGGGVLGVGYAGVEVGGGGDPVEGFGVEVGGAAGTGHLV